jgi:hypothetical protein
LEEKWDEGVKKMEDDERLWENGTKMGECGMTSNVYKRCDKDRSS